MSIVRGRGIDPAALRYLAAHHDVASVMFVDGWTGKGAIARELVAALDVHAHGTGDRFPPDLAVLADPGRCVSLYGTREDFLIPSACLNSTVSGLVSRTVLNAQLLRPDQFHGAKFYPELADADVSARFLDAVTAHFDGVADDVERDWRTHAATDRTPDWAGWAAVERIIGDLRHRRRQPRQARRRRDHPGPAAARAVEGAGPPAPTPTSATSACSPPSGACRSRRSRTCRTAASD